MKKFKEGDIAAVGCMVDSCRKCASCLAGEEQYCENVMTLTYNSEDKILGGVTYGGYSDSIVVDEAYVLRVPNGLDPAGTAPLLCAGITTYSPLRHWNVAKDRRWESWDWADWATWGVKFAKAFGAHVVLFTTSPNKKRRCGPAGRRRSDRFHGRRGDAEAGRQFRFHSGRGFRGPRFERLSATAETRRHDDAGGRA